MVVQKGGALPGSVGAFEAYMRSLPPVIGLGFGGYGEWSKEVGFLIGQLAKGPPPQTP